MEHMQFQTMGDAIAYSVSGDIYNTDTIRVLNMSNDSAYEIKAEEGDTLKALGYIQSDFIYGMQRIRIGYIVGSRWQQ